MVSWQLVLHSRGGDRSCGPTTVFKGTLALISTRTWNGKHNAAGGEHATVLALVAS